MFIMYFTQIKYVIVIVVNFVGYLYIMDLMNAWKIENIEKKWQWTFEFHKVSGIYCLAERLLALQSMRFLELVCQSPGH